MALSVVTGNGWRALVSSLSSWLVEERPGVFETVTIVVSSRSVARLLRQSLAGSLPSGICAGVEFVTLPQWIQTAARRHSLSDELSAWRSMRLQLTVAEALSTMVESGTFPVLAAHLGAQGSPARRLQLAGRLARLLRRYVDWAPGMVAAWLEADEQDEDEAALDAQGRPLPMHLAWQPELLRLVVETLEVDPVETWENLSEAMASDDTPRRTAFFALTDVSTSQAGLIAQHSSGRDDVLWQVDAPHLADWTTRLSAERTHLQGETTGPRLVAVHGSHSAQRQAEVLRDELCRRFEADPTLEPRDVLVVCPDPQQWWPHLRTVFSPATDDAMAHPGRSLRVQLASEAEPNPVLRLIREVLRLADARATASDITELLLLPPVAHRWRLSNRRDQVSDLVAAAGVRWGLDERHRGMLGLAGVTQNTWLRGLDRLMAGLTLAPGADALPITGVSTVGTSDLELVGTLSELISRLRKFVHGASGAATGDVWVERVRGLLSDLVGPSFADEWMTLEAHAVLTDMADQLRHCHADLSRVEFARLFDTSASDMTPRSAVGNGSLHVVRIGELAHVPFRLVCLLGVGDPATAGDADLVHLGEGVPDARGQRQEQLVTHARAAEEVLIVLQDRDARTNAWLAEPTAVTALVRELGCEVRRSAAHPLHAHAEENFTGKRLSFDSHALQAATTLRTVHTDAASARDVRRTSALTLSGSASPPEATLEDLHRVLKDPAQTFLQSTAGVRIFSRTELRDELPLRLDGLEAWSVQDRLLEALRSGLLPLQAAEQEFQRESLPPGLIGRGMLRKPMENAMTLWEAARKDLDAPRTEHRVELELNGVSVQDTLVLHGGHVVHAVASKGIKHELLPWLRVLALAATGIPARAVVHRMDRENFFDVCVRREIVAPDKDVAHELLLVVADAFRQGHNRLLPLPLEPALVMAGQLVGGRPDPKAWERRTRDWESPWRFLPPQWQLFYGDDAPTELVGTPRTDRDPLSDSDSAFAAWAQALYVPMLRAGM